MQIIDLEQRAVIQDAPITNQDPTLTIEHGWTTLASDGATLLVALMLLDANNRPSASEFQLFDARTLSRQRVLRFDRPINTYATTLSDGMIYAATFTPQATRRGPYPELVMIDTATGKAQSATTLDNEDIRQILIGR